MLPWGMQCGKETGLNGGDYSLMGRQLEIQTGKHNLKYGLVNLLGYATFHRTERKSK